MVILISESLTKINKIWMSKFEVILKKQGEANWSSQKSKTISSLCFMII